MASPTLNAADRTSNSHGTNTNPWVVTYCANIAAGNRLVLAVAVDSADTATNLPTYTAPGGWNAIEDFAFNPTLGAKLLVLEKIATGAETGTFNLDLSSSEQGAWVMDRISGAHASEAADKGTLAEGASGANPNPPIVTAGWTGEENLFMAVAALSHGDSALTAPPTNYGNELFLGGGTTTGAAIMIAYRALTADTDNPGEFTLVTGRNWAAQTIVLRPAVVGAGRVLDETFEAVGFDETWVAGP